MKRALILSLALVAIPAVADVVAYMPNNGGGQIILTDRKGNCQSGLFAFTRGSSQRTTFGCWSLSEGFVFVRWSDGDVRTYYESDFTVVPKGKKGGEV